MLHFEDLQDGKGYIATATDGKQYKGTFCKDYFPGGVFFSVWPAYTADGRKNDLVFFKEVQR